MKLSVVFTVIFVSFFMQIIYKNRENQEEDNGDSIIFRYSSFYQKIMLGFSIFFIILTLIFAIVSIVSDETAIIASIIMSLFVFMFMFFYLKTKNMRIIYFDKTFYLYSALKKQKIINIEDIEKAIEFPSKGMRLVLKDKSKIDMDMQLINYPKIKKILEENNIPYQDTTENEEL